MSEQTQAAANPAPQNNSFALIVLATVFFAFGFATAFKDPLVHHLIGVFNLSHAQGDLIQFAFFIAYFVVSIPSTLVVTRLGHQKSIVVGLVVMGLGALLIVPAAGILSYGLFLCGLWVMAAGITLIQVAANPFATLLGAPEKAPARLTIVQAFNSLGTTIAPFLGAKLILSGRSEAAGTVMSRAEQLSQAALVKAPYIGMAIALFIVAFVILRIKMPKPDQGAGAAGTWGSCWKYPHLVFGVIAIFVYVGAEVTIGGHIIDYVLYNMPGVVANNAGVYASLYWGGAMVGRFLGTAILGRFSGGKVLGVCGVVALLLCLTTMFTSGAVAVWSVALVGLFNSIMFPTTFALAVAKLGPLTGKASGLLNMAIFGGAVVPLLQGRLIDIQSIGFHLSFVVPALCYLFIMFYGFSGSKVKNSVV